MKHKIDYFGYVYQWNNKITGKKYIGSHFGSVEDYYKGSGKYFKSAYEKNPTQFEMIVLEYVITNDKKELLRAEQQWLDTIDNIQTNPEYYNLSSQAGGGWHHVTEEQKRKRIENLKKRIAEVGLTEAERASYKTKIQTRLDRIAKIGFTKKEKEQHQKYGYQIQITSPTGKIKIYNSCGEATRELGIDVQYGLKVCSKRVDFKGYKIVKLRDPITDCR
jgi:hypothetical protein